ncbi:MAG: M48 family metallopeptidase [Pseudomonadota bacterium]|nr:M48 family metallopeptidase [Pseudomonadota bacterium]
MTPFAARYFDGHSSAARAVQVVCAADALRLLQEDGEIRIALPQVRIGDRLGSAPQVIYLEGGGELHSDDHAAVDALAGRLGQGRMAARIFRLESRTWIALVALLFSVAAAWFGLRHGLPLLAQAAADWVPPGIEAGMGEQALTVLDKLVFQPSALPAARQKVLRQRLQAVCRQAGDCPAWRLEFRGGGEIGANALALPGGTLVFTDEIVKLARHDDELIAVAAHELGHVQHRHALRQVLAGAGVVLLAQVLLGEMGQIGDLASGLPALLLQTGYTRTMEREAEAEAHALALMRRICLPPRRFADLLQRLDASHPGSRAAATLFSTHPSMRDRIKVFQAQELVTRGC